MTHEEFTGVTFNDLTHPEPGFQGYRTFPSSTAQSAYFMNRKTTDKIIVYARNTERGQ